MTTPKARLYGGSSLSHARGGFNFMDRGPTIAFAPDDPPAGGGDDDDAGDDPPATVAKDVHDRIVAAHDALKRDSRADRTELRTLREKVTNLEAELEAEQAKHDDTDKSTALAAQKAAFDLKAAEDKAKSDKRIKELDDELNDTAADRALDTALDEHRVKPELRKAAKALLRADIEVEVDDSTKQRVAYLGALPLDQAVKAWAEGDEGKVFVLDGNSGGGSPGQGRAHGGKNPWKADQRSLTEQDRIERKDPALAGRLKAEAGVA